VKDRGGGRTTFTLPAALSAVEPAEARGLTRDQVRLLVAGPNGTRHVGFRDLEQLVCPGDVVVVNTSATLAAAVEGTRVSGGAVVVHFSTPLEDGTWIVELRSPDASEPVLDAVAGEVVGLAGSMRMDLLQAHPDARRCTHSRLWRVRVAVDGPVEAYLAEHGRPISYGYVNRRWPLSAYQTVFARAQGSAEMPSAARPFTDGLVTRMVARGINFAPVLLHTGVSSLDTPEPPLPERFHVPAATARLVNHVRRAGGRVIAVGTTVTRALETVARSDGTVSAGRGWTDLILGPDRPARAIDGLVTGWHAPGASHLLLLEAVAGPQLVQNAYEAALEARYLWHEFGDSCLLLVPREPKHPRSHGAPQHRRASRRV
jgi:S-adenosylmethionine:tRNA ribosyltransferase-isomerase